MSFEWTENRVLAAQLLAEGRLADHEIAEKCGIARSTLYEWRKNVHFQARVADHLARFKEEVHRRGIACRDRRVKRQNDHWNRLQSIVEARGEHFARLTAEERVNIHPGALTGLMVVDKDGQWSVDADILKELRALEQHAARELGQWSEKHELDLTGLSDAELIARATGLLGGSGPPRPETA